MNGRLIAGGLVAFAGVFGVALWYFQNYAYYRPLVLDPPQAPQTAVATPDGPQTDTAPSATPAPGEGDVTSSPPQVPGDDNAGVAADADTQPGARPSVDVATNVPSPGDEDTAPAATDPEAQPALAPAPASPPTPDTDEAAVAPANDPDEAFADVNRNVRHIRLQMIRVNDGLPENIDAQNFTGIDAPTSPLKLRGCFTVVNSFGYLTETYEIYDDATPLKAPSWFDCFDYETLTDDIESGDAIAFLAGKDVANGIDRVVAVYGDGRAFVWQQLNDKFKE